MNGQVQMEDKSGQPRSGEELKEALGVVERVIVKCITKVPPQLALQLPTILDVLQEAIVFRGLTEGKQIGWYDPGGKRFCYMDVKEHAQLNSYASYTEPVYVLHKE